MCFKGKWAGVMGTDLGRSSVGTYVHPCRRYVRAKSGFCNNPASYANEQETTLYTELRIVDNESVVYPYYIHLEIQIMDCNGNCRYMYTNDQTLL